MAWRTEKTSIGTDLVYDGVENGIAPSPLKGTANLQNVNIATELGEAFVSFARTNQNPTQAPITNGTLTATVGLGNEYLDPSASLDVGQWINISSTNINLEEVVVNYGVIAGGGGGGGSNGTDAGGGGGAGGIDEGYIPLGIGTYAVTVGAGGAGAAAGASGSDGSNSSIAALVVATGGGGGGQHGANGRKGGSGGGGGGNPGAPGQGGNGLAGQGFDGGRGDAASNGGGGGGGYSAVGGNASATAVGGNGGAGGVVNVPGAGATYGGGGGGGNGGLGGEGGGAAGGAAGNPGANATANTGGGGGGGATGTQAGGNGGSGRVIITYLTGTVTATGGTITTNAGYTIHTFTSNGTFEITAIPLQTGHYFVSAKNGSGDVKLSPTFDPTASIVIQHGTSGTATFSTVHPAVTTTFIAKASEKYQTETSTEYRYYLLDADGYVWVRDTAAVTPAWMLSDPTDYSSYDFTGMAVINGWLLCLTNTEIWGKPTVKLGPSFTQLDNSYLNNPFPTHTNFAYVGHQGKMYYCDGNYLGELFPTTSLVTGVANIQSYAIYDSTVVTVTATAALTTGTGAITLTAAWSDGVASKAYLLKLSSGETRIGTLIANKTGFTLDSAVEFDATSTIEIVSVGTVTTLIEGSLPYTLNASGTVVRIPAVFFAQEDGTLPYAIDEETVYYIEQRPPGNTFAVYAAASGGNPLDISSGLLGTQYFNTFYPIGDDAGIDGTNALVQFSPQRLNLPEFEITQCMVELGNIILIGGVTNTLYPWNQIDATPSDIISLPESNVKAMVNANNMGYVFAGNKGNIYITNNSTAALAYKVPDYCAGVPGTPFSYIEPYFTWGDAAYIRGRIYFSILDQTATKAGNCGGIWSFYPTENFSYGQETGLALRLENQNSYGNYSGMATLILPDEEQNAIAPQYWSTWQNSYTVAASTTFGIDGTSSNPVTTAVIETDRIPTGTLLNKRTFQQVEYKVGTPLQSGDGVQLYYRLNATDSWTSLGTVQEESSNRLSGYWAVNFEKTQWVQLRAVLSTGGTTASSFIRLNELRLR